MLTTSCAAQDSTPRAEGCARSPFKEASAALLEYQRANHISGDTKRTDANGKIQTKLEAGTYEVTEIEAPEGYKLPDNPTTEITISKATTSENITITNEKKTGTVTVTLTATPKQPA